MLYQHYIPYLSITDYNNSPFDGNGYVRYFTIGFQCDSPCVVFGAIPRRASGIVYPVAAGMNGIDTPGLLQPGWQPGLGEPVLYTSPGPGLITLGFEVDVFGIILLTAEKLRPSVVLHFLQPPPILG